MRYALAALIAVHGAIHLLGFVKGLGLAEVSQLQQDIGPRAGVIWLCAATLLIGAAVAVLVTPRFWWLPALPALLLSQTLIFGAWSDARFGTVVNVILLAAVVLALGNGSPRAGAQAADPTPDADRSAHTLRLLR